VVEGGGWELPWECGKGSEAQFLRLASCADRLSYFSNTETHGQEEAVGQESDCA